MTWITQPTSPAVNLHNLVEILTARNRHFLISNQKRSSCRKARECPAHMATCKPRTDQTVDNPMTDSEITTNSRTGKARSPTVISIHQIPISREKYPKETCSRKWERIWATMKLDKWLKIPTKKCSCNSNGKQTWGTGESRTPASIAMRASAGRTSSAPPRTLSTRVRCRRRCHQSRRRGRRLRSTISRRRAASPLLADLSHPARRARDTCSTTSRNSMPTRLLETHTMMEIAATTGTQIAMICRPFPPEKVETWIQSHLISNPDHSGSRSTTTQARRTFTLNNIRRLPKKNRLLRKQMTRVWINRSTRSKSSNIAHNCFRRSFWTEKSSAPWPRGLTPRLPTLAWLLHGCLRDSEGWEKRELKDVLVCLMPPFTSSPTKKWNLSGRHKYLVSLRLDLGKTGFRWVGIRRSSASKPTCESR